LRSLFVRIFVSFWLAMSLISVGVAVVYLVREPASWIERSRLLTGQALQLHARNVLALRAEGRDDAAAAAARDLQERTDIQAWVLSPDALLLPSPDLGPALVEAGRDASRSGQAVWRESSTVDTYAAPVEGEGSGGAVVVGEIHHPSAWSRLLGPRPIGLRLLIAFLVSGVVSYALARHLTKPIGTLRAATRALAEERLDVRVTPLLGRRHDEIAALGRDFDLMADRIQGLLEDQRRLLRDVSHELRSPLARLGVALELARQVDNGTAAPQLDRIEREAERLNELIGQVLSVAQLEAQTAGAEREPVPLLDLVKEVVADADFEAQSQGRAVDLVDGGPAVVRGVEEILRRAVENVVRNAVRFTAEGTHVEVSVGTRPTPTGEVAQVRVRDRGPGVPDEELERIFQPFVRVDQARDRKRGGTGIGLAVTQRAVHLHGGTVEARNAPDGGLIVTLALPLGG
jgi:signal transduction histidine kinase